MRIMEYKLFRTSIYSGNEHYSNNERYKIISYCMITIHCTVPRFFRHKHTNCRSFSPPNSQGYLGFSNMQHWIPQRQLQSRMDSQTINLSRCL